MRHGLASGWTAAAVMLCGLVLVVSDVSAGAAPGIAPGEVQAAEPPAEKAAEAPVAEPPESLLHWLYRTLRLRYVVIFLFLTINLVALMVMNVLAVWRDHVLPPALIQRIHTRLGDKRHPEVYDLVRDETSLLGRVVATGAAHVAAGYEAAEAAMQEVGRHEAMKMHQRLGYVALIAQISPLVGLLGTVDGMITTLEAIAQQDLAPGPSVLAEGIGTALVATVVGLWIAIPAVAFYHVVRNRMNRLLSEVGIVSENIVKRLAVAAKKSAD